MQQRADPDEPTNLWVHKRPASMRKSNDGASGHAPFPDLARLPFSGGPATTPRTFPRIVGDATDKPLHRAHHG